MTEIDKIEMFCGLMFIGWVCPMAIGYAAACIYRKLKHKEE